MKIAFITVFSSHYRVKTFETLAEQVDTDFYFFSDGGEWYWQKQHGVSMGKFRARFLPGWKIGNTRITPTLPLEIMRPAYDVYIKCINGKFALPLCYLAARLKRKPFILWTGVWMRLNTPLHRLFFPLVHYIYTHADALVVYGEHVKRYLVSEGVPAERIFTTTHAVDNDLYNVAIAPAQQAALREQLKIAPNQKVILYLGRLADGKGLEHLLEGFAGLRYDDAILLFAGDGPLRPTLIELAVRYGISAKVRFAGYIKSDQTVPYYSIADMLVLPSVTTNVIKETWGLVINEGFNQGVPAIVTDAVGAAAGGFVRDGENGLIVAEHDSGALQNALQRLLDDEALRQRMSANARTIVQGWNNDNMVRGFCNAIEYALSQRGTHE